VFNFHCKRK